MDFLSFCSALNNFLALPSTFIFLGAALFLTIKIGFPQIRGFKYFFKLIKKNAPKNQIQELKTINPFHALFTAMATTMGMGNIVGPTVAIVMGGPGALFWLVLYTILGAATKFTEVTFALFTRKRNEQGDILGGPTEYLSLIHPKIGQWYGIITLFLFAGWSGLQANTLGKILEQENISPWITGLVLSTILLVILLGGVKRLGAFASKLVPLMFTLYISFALFIIFKDINVFRNAIHLIFSNIITPAAAVGGFLGASVFEAIRWGTYRGIYITEAGIGTSSIPHALADVKKPIDQGVLAMFGVAAETFLCLMSGLVVLVTGVWLNIKPGIVTNTLIYEAFKMHSPLFGRWVLIVSIALFVLTTVVGNSFNGGQSFAYFTKHRWVNIYYIFAAIITFLGSMSHVKLIWDIMDIFLALIAIPNLIGLVILSIRYPKVLKIED